jgi:hypothetical protein
MNARSPKGKSGTSIGNVSSTAPFKSLVRPASLRAGWLARSPRNAPPRLGNHTPSRARRGMRGGADAVARVASRARSPPGGIVVTAVGLVSLATPRARPPTPARMTRSPPLTTFVVSVSDVGDGAGARKTRFCASPDGDPLTYREVLRLWRTDRAFRDVFLRALADEPHAAFFYETPPVTRATLDRPYEHVITDAPVLAGLPPDPRPFREHLSDARARGDPVAVFLNLGGDATLVAPVDDALPASAFASACAHLADFVRGADADARHALLRATAEAVEARVGDAPTWVSTSGAGVSWLHVRIDRRPKYYVHDPYSRHASAQTTDRARVRSQ